MQIFGDNVSPPYHNVHTRKSSSPIPAHTKTHSSIDTRHSSHKRSSSSHQHAIPVKLNTVYALLVPVCGKVSQRFLLFLFHLPFVFPPPTILAGLFYAFVPRRYDAFALDDAALLGDRRLYTPRSHIYNSLSFMQLLPHTDPMVASPIFLPFVAAWLGSPLPFYIIITTLLFHYYSSVVARPLRYSSYVVHNI